MRGAKSIRLVNDQDAVRSSWGRELNNEGCEVIEARNGRKARKRAAERDPDLVLLDIVMSEMDGMEAMGAHGGHGMSGMISDEQMERLEAASGAEFDQLFVEYMIEHHEGAIEMAEDVEDSQDPRVAALARAIIQTQQVEIDQCFRICRSIEDLVLPDLGQQGLQRIQMIVPRMKSIPLDLRNGFDQCGGQGRELFAGDPGWPVIPSLIKQRQVGNSADQLALADKPVLLL